jgi:hypothetical protein
MLPRRKCPQCRCCCAIGVHRARALLCISRIHVGGLGGGTAEAIFTCIRRLVGALAAHGTSDLFSLGGEASRGASLWFRH